MYDSVKWGSCHSNYRQILMYHNFGLLYIQVLLNHRFPKVKKMFGWIMNVNEINDEYVEVWITYFEAFWLFNVVGEAIPQLIIRLTFWYFLPQNVKWGHSYQLKKNCKDLIFLLNVNWFKPKELQRSLMYRVTKETK